MAKVTYTRTGLKLNHLVEEEEYLVANAIIVGRDQCKQSYRHNYERIRENYYNGMSFSDVDIENLNASCDGKVPPIRLISTHSDAISLMDRERKSAWRALAIKKLNEMTAEDREEFLGRQRRNVERLPYLEPQERPILPQEPNLVYSTEKLRIADIDFTDKITVVEADEIPELPVRRRNELLKQIIDRAGKGGFLFVEEANPKIRALIASAANGSHSYGVRVRTRSNFNYKGKVGVGIWIDTGFVGDVSKFKEKR